MPTLESVNVAEAASALGIGPAGVRRMIATGQLPAARIGRAWRILVEDVNRLLRPANLPPGSASTPSMSQAETSSTAAQPRVESPQTLTAMRACPPGPFSASDTVYIEHYRRQLASPDPEVQRQAGFHLGMFAEAAAQDPTAAIQRSAKRVCDQEAITLLW
jgi:excisionase family DNA binding protein